MSYLRKIIPILLITIGFSIVIYEAYRLDSVGGEKDVVVDDLGSISALRTADNDKMVSLIQELTQNGCTQVIKGNAVEKQLATRLNERITVDTIEGKEGKGCRIEIAYPEKTISIGIGAYAEQNTYTIERGTATTT